MLDLKTDPTNRSRAHSADLDVSVHSATPEQTAFIVRAVNAHDDLVTQLRGVVAAFRCVVSTLEIDEDETTLNISAGGKPVAQVPIATLLANANSALAKAEGK